MATLHGGVGTWKLTSTTLALDNTRRFTAVCRIYVVDQPNTYWAMFAVGQSSGACAQVYNIRNGANNAFKFSLYNGTNFDETTDQSRSTGVWYDVALVMGANLELWVDGSFVVSVPAVSVGSGIEIGDDSSGTGFNGRIDDIRIYENVAMTPRELQLERRASHPYHANKYTMPFRFIASRADADFSYSSGRRPFSLTVSGTRAWAEGAPVAATRGRRRGLGASGAAQDTPELYGRPGGSSGRRQMSQLLAT